MDFVKLSREQRRSLERATKRYEKAMWDDLAISLPARDFLQDRGIEEDVARTFRLGYVEEPEVGHELGEGRLAIPYLTPKGVVSMRFRSLDSDIEPKYLGVDGDKTRLFNVQALHEKSDFIVICEGELDALVMSSIEIPAVGLPGAENWKPHFGRLFDDYDRVLIAMDMWKYEEGFLVRDKAGRAAARKLKDHLPNGVIVDLEVGDVNEAYLQEGPDFIRERLGVA